MQGKETSSRLRIANRDAIFVPQDYMCNMWPAAPLSSVDNAKVGPSILRITRKV